MRTSWCGVAVLGLAAVGCAGGPVAPADPATRLLALLQEPEDPNAAWARVGAPGVPHQRLATLAGEWNAEAKMWAGPGEPQVSTATATNVMVLGGRFLWQHFTGQMMGQPFEGRGLLGYDNVTQKYVGVWCDATTTGMSVMTAGTADAEAKVITLPSEITNPAGQVQKYRYVWRLTGPDAHAFELHAVAADGQAQKFLEISFTRAAAAAAK